MKAVIMAGGEGTRLRPLTSNQPKPMMPIVNRPMMEHIISLLRSHGFDEIVVTVAFMADAIRNYFGDGSEFGVKMTYVTEETPLGTAGSVRNAKDHLKEPFLVISGDVLTDINLKAIVDLHNSKGAMATIGLISVENPLEFGIVITNDDGSIDRFLEKPTWGQVFTDTINTGIYVLDPAIFDYIEPDASVDFSSDVFPRLLEDNKPMFGAVGKGYWEDVGTLDAYVRAHTDVLDGKIHLEIDGFEMAPNVWVAEGADVHPNARVDGPAVIGANCSVGQDARLGEYVVLGTGVRLGNDSTLERTVVGDNAYLAESVRLRGTVVGRACDLRRGVRCEEGVVLGDEVFVGDDAVIGDEVKVYPFKTIESGAVVNTSIIWESKGARSLFGRDRVVGLSNVDMSPELAAKVALAYATLLKKNDTVAISRDSSRSARMLKRAFMSGLNAGGINVVDLEVASVPFTRFNCRQGTTAGGVTIRLEDGDAEQVMIRFFGDGGEDIAPERRRKIERIFGREDFRRVRPTEIGDILMPPRAVEHYAVSLESTVDVDAIAARRFKMVIDYAYGAVSHVMPNVLAKLQGEVLALNPYASTRGFVNYDRDEHTSTVADLVVASHAQIGAVIDQSGEVLTLIDDRGHVLTAEESLFVMLDLISDRIVGDTIALPVAASAKAEALILERGLKVRWTKMSPGSLAEAANDPGVGLAADLNGGFILPGFLPALDGSAAFLKVLDLLALRDESLSDHVARVPETHVVREYVVTPWESKGTVMRELVEQNKGRQVELVDGVKIRHADGWVLMLPDPEEPLTHIWAEGPTTAEATSLAREYARRVQQIQR
jgi:mannose-1-phosphate guanylyltransferase/phosphomannomutase